MKFSTLAPAALATAIAASSAFADGHAKELPPLVMQPNAERVTFEHIDALNACDWDRLMAQYPEEVLIILPNGVWVEGRSAIGDVFAGFCTPREEGGFIDYADVFAPLVDQALVQWISETSNYFQLNAVVQIDTVRVSLFSVLHRNGQTGTVTPILRKLGTI